MKTLLIVYHSLTGGTRQMAEAAAAGAATESGIDVHVLQATATGPAICSPRMVISSPRRRTSQHLRD